MFEEAMGEFMTSLGILKKKFDLVDTKMEELGSLTEDVHSSTDKLEVAYKKDVEARKKHF